MSTARVNVHDGASPHGLSIEEAARRVGVAPSTLRRWARQGLLPGYNGSWSPAVVGHAKIVARLRERGHPLEEIRKAGDQGRLAYGYVEELFDTGLPLVALLQLVRVYGQAMARVADAEVRLFHMHVHEPLMRSGATGIETADEMLELTRRRRPASSRPWTPSSDSSRMSRARSPTTRA